ncbi:unnamed protein product [Arabidopsis lyrata]|nr:unnamed protein product [Arabidopsis lyrata]
MFPVAGGSDAVNTRSQPHQKQSLPSYFHLYPLVEKLSDEIETGSLIHW